MPINDVRWALSNNRKLIETYHYGHVTQWKIVEAIAQCYMCDAPHEMGPLVWHNYCGRGAQPAILENSKWLFWTPVCDKCVARFDKAFHEESEGRLPFQSHWDFISRPEIDQIASQDRSANVRWVRTFVAKGNFTRSEFKKLCLQYSNSCVRCGKKRNLVPDHVVPIAKGGTNDITNIQPLCAPCNGIKSDKTFDFRKK